ncbi:oxygenase MpaB family protein [Georgenia satyanarayanai]|uniref:oxygenase MpaB family protein n=1 Tax=Georgenia satyanarayanai TaxID=860221 RepID=UPI0012653E19|nr:oxygenase MpaB family protein [Georgenia satyanarayanai]
MTSVRAARRRLSDLLMARVAGPEAQDARRRIHGEPGERWYGPEDPIQRVHGDASMYVGGLRALLLQSLHPLAMAAVAQHSDYRNDPWGRLARTSTFIAETTYARVEDAERAVAIVRAVHRHISGTTTDGVAYRADDPRLITWVHIAEIDSFLTAHQRFGARPLTPAETDTYVAQAAGVARRLGGQDVPTTHAELRTALEHYRPELRSTPEALEAAQFLLHRPPVTGPARAGYALIGRAAVATLPRWARAPLRLPDHPRRDATLGAAAGHVATHSLRWVMGGLDAAPTPRAVSPR